MKRKIEADDFYKLKLSGDPQAAPDGLHIAFTLTEIDPEKNRYLSSLWLTDTNGAAPRRLTSQESSSSLPRWSPDGTRLAFLSDRKKPKSSIWILPLEGGEAQALGGPEEEGSISGFRWSPDGSHIVFQFRATPEHQREADAEERKKKGLSASVRRHTRLNYRGDGAGFHDDVFGQIWLLECATGTCRQLADLPYPTSLPVWSPDGKTLAFTADARPERDITGPHTSLYLLSLKGGEPEKLPSPPGSKFALTWSPDGSHFAYLGNPDPEDGWSSNNTRLLVLPVSGGKKALDLTAKFDVSVGFDTLSDTHSSEGGDGLFWTPDSKALLFPVSEWGNTFVCRTSADGSGPLEKFTPPGGETAGFCPLPGFKSAVVSYGTGVHPHSLFLIALEEGAKLKPLCDLNEAYCKETAVLEPEELNIARPGGGTVHGWLLRPNHFNPKGSYPLVVYVHGGPHLQYGNAFFHELQLLAAEGYVVLYINPRGSRGYGEAHTKAIRGSWGGVDFEDVMTATDYAVALPGVDAKRTAIMGGSYGGYMTAWAVGHTDRYTCAIADRLVANLPSMSGTCDFTWRPGSYFQGKPWEYPSDLWQSSPLAYAERIVTPLLLIHSDGDLRCPAGQAEEMFAALRLQNKTVEYVRYPAETSHGLSRNGPPDMRLHRLQTNLEWLGRWLKS